MRNVLDRNCRKYQNIYFMFCNKKKEKRAIYKVMWQNLVRPNRPQTTVKYSTCALHFGQVRLQTHSQNMKYLLLFHGNNGYANANSILRYTYIASLVIYSIITYHIGFSLFLSLFLSVFIYYFLHKYRH
jgi:hypothetical protein